MSSSGQNQFLQKWFIIYFMSSSIHPTFFTATSFSSISGELSKGALHSQAIQELTIFWGGVYPRASSKNMPRTPHLGGAQEVPFNEQRQLYSEPLWIYPSSSLYLQVRTLEEVLPLVSQFFQSLLITRGHR